MYKYETHLHSSPASKCGSYSVRENLEFYKKMGYDGVFLTNHFINANIGCDRTLPYEDQVEFFFKDIEEGERIADEVGIKFFWGVETSYLATDFLIYGLSKEWYLEHPEIVKVGPKEMLTIFAEHGALIVHAHPFRHASYIDHIRLLPGEVHAVEVDNAANKEQQNEMALLYANCYGIHHCAGSDNHIAGHMHRLAGMEFEEPITSIEDFVQRMKRREGHTFSLINEQ